MVLEWLLSAKKDRKSPLHVFMFSFLVSAIAIFISYNVFKESTGIFTIVIISITMVPFINAMLWQEEIETERYGQNQTFFDRHGDIIVAFTAIFIGMTSAMFGVFTVLPQSAVDSIFQDQIKEVNIIQGRFTFSNKFLEIVANNISVLMLSFIFSFLLRSGAILILSWNASVLAAAMGLLAKSVGGVAGVPVAVLTFIPHGTFELLAYFIGAIAGGMISASIVRKKSYRFGYIISDSVKLLIISFVLLAIGAVIESFILIS